MEISNRVIKEPEKLIFSLDIGTRTVIGIVGEYDDGNFKIIESTIKEHNKRNMYDGQIHDIEGVTKVVKEVKEELEEKLGITLKKVAIAAAGRALKTSRVKIDKEIDITTEITRQMIEALELEAVQKAEEALDVEKTGKDFRYYCIGYSVVNYYLDESFIENLEGHKGEKMSVDLLATFLPQIVVDSLYAVVSRAGLQVANITLEPIAAINVAIKQNLRLLNLALVDIGAGTSDIAITKDGTIVAYAMTSTAGDELTESLAKNFLLDFDSSEKLKVSLNSEEIHEFQDIVGIEHSMSTDEIVSSIEDVIDNLAKEISEKIIEYNGKAPSAVFLIGGSSQIPRLNEYIANYLGLPKERVAIRDVSHIENIFGITDELKGPDIVTPIGIAMEGVNNKYKNFLDIYVNGEELKVFNTDLVKVADILVLIGYNPRKLIPEKGEDFIYYVNGKKEIVSGELGKPAEIYVNGELGSINTKLNDRDYLEIREGTKGNKNIPYLYDCVPFEKMVILDNEEIQLIFDIKVNGMRTNDNIRLKNGDKIEYNEIEDVYDLISYLKLDKNKYSLYKNEEQLDLNYILNNGDVLEIKALANKKSEKNNIRLIINGEEKIIYHNKEKFIFVDIFNYIDFDITKAKGKLILKLNGRDAEYMEQLNHGDEIDIYWEN
ncbi:cell division protein FtsA [Anaerosalibacter sp. Marseille-P3206]|uniref:cell division protein FtsA n=1 Tax=Anaerosalibacter sp. Marseille-P3206 TaxID=1871005 RepID=UPI0009867451|nr:cell division FtsA domain-containing protein [Anaerosalibacter sp. Marseille-P3206]